MKGSDLIQIATAVYGINWFDSVCQELGIDDKELSKYTDAEELPGPVVYAMSDIASKYMARVESMQIHSKFQDNILNAEIESSEQVAFMSGVIKGMALVLSAMHGEPEELKALAKEKDYKDIIEGYMTILS